MTPLSDGTKITSHTCHHRTASTWPCHHILLFSWPICWKKKKLLSPAPPLILFCLFIILFSSLPPFSPPPLHGCRCMCLQSQTAASGQGDVPLNREEFSVGDSTGEKLIVFPSVQSTPSTCHVNLSPFLSPPYTPSISSITLWVPCWFPSEANGTPAASGLPFVPVALFVVTQFLHKSPLWFQFRSLISRIW